ncbi:TadE/TadG family type IV pilus assembly protein [Pelagovum pacificum]|uniref:Pilus assembly protein n=1 Tax=Pelagovum pacificum TaxID=2588711 RepID=A0A5C5GGL8_9RHOB|nr:TadE/TadG family type IV pilus assembly protein [Pelagovum pacificum]QQA43679.1 pilus assembly protein [Pelagovum pacificum]TNY33187.1 pilus assembly protein [Pelagovum pacificum]
MIAKLRRFTRLFRKDKTGNATIEFCIVFPVFMVLTVSAFETGLLMTRQMMLERGLDMAVRAVRLGTGREVDDEALRKMICNGAGIIPECLTELKVEMVELDPRNWTDLPRRPDCVDRNNPTAPSRNFVNGGSHELMVLRACALFDPIFPNFGIGIQLTKESKYYALVSTSVFVMEPG